MTKKKSKYQELEKKIAYQPHPAWDIWKEKDRQTAFQFAEGYKKFLDQAKTEREAIVQVTKLARRRGYVDLATVRNIKQPPGRKFYLTHQRKCMALALLGSKPLTAGVAIIIAHVDSPRLDLKGRPLFEDSNLALAKTHYYGGIKKYQWMNIPLSLHGTIVRSNGAQVTLALGEGSGDPLFTVADLEPHLARRQYEKKLGDAIAGEDLKVLVGGLPVADVKIKHRFKLAALEHLYRRYGVTEEDLISAELELVPAYMARDIGLDRSLIGAYGQDDRSCVYTALQALLSRRKVQHTAILLLVDKEEIGSEGNTGARGGFIDGFIAELVARLGVNETARDRWNMWCQSRALSGDVTGAVNPTFKDVFELQNAPLLGNGITIAKYGGHRGKVGTSDASAEYMAVIRDLFNRNHIPWQSGEHGKIDIGGGGTVAKFIAEYGVEIVDCGPGLLGLHAPWEVSHKADIYATFLGYSAFFDQHY